MPLIERAGFSPNVTEDDSVEIDLSARVIGLADGTEFFGSRLPDFLLEIIEDGGLIPRLTKDRLTSAWQNYKVVLDVPAAATGIYFGILVDGPGTVWMSCACLLLTEYLPCSL